jgi:hypothetical protein
MAQVYIYNTRFKKKKEEKVPEASADIKEEKDEQETKKTELKSKPTKKRVVKYSRHKREQKKTKPKTKKKDEGKRKKRGRKPRLLVATLKMVKQKIGPNVERFETDDDDDDTETDDNEEIIPKSPEEKTIKSEKFISPLPEILVDFTPIEKYNKIIFSHEYTQAHLLQFENAVEIVDFEIIELE